MQHALLIAVLLASVLAHAGPINIIDYRAISNEHVITFSGVDGGLGPGTNYDDLIVTGGVSFGEHFAGQTVYFRETDYGGSDLIAGQPDGELTLLAGTPNRNLVVLFSDSERGNNVLTGAGIWGYPTFAGVGEGAIAMLFSTDQSQVGLSILGDDGGEVFLSFYRRDGSLIDAITLTGNSVLDYGFGREGGIADVAGMTIYSTDIAGIEIDNIQHDVASLVPEPAPALMLVAGLAFAACSRRAKRQKAASTHA